MTDWEKAGLHDFFTSDIRAEAIAVDMAKNLLTLVCVAPPKSSADAIEKVIHYCDSVQKILDKKAVTKDILATYLMSKGALSSQNATKQGLIQQILAYWKTKYITTPAQEALSPPSTTTTHENALKRTPQKHPEEAPVNVLSREFTSWFYKKLNTSSLTQEDLWPDAFCAIRLVQNDSVTDESAEGREGVLEKLLSTRQMYNFTFNPNVQHAGVQGRISPHGLVIVVACGTLHIGNRWVGVFESAFGLVQDPSAGPNHWKCKHLKIELRSTQQESLPTLQECNSIRDIIELPADDTLRLIQQILAYWKTKYITTPAQEALSPPSTTTTHENALKRTPQKHPEEAPVNVLSREFTSWFYKKLNTSSLTQEDLWPDAFCAIRLVQNDSVTDESAEGREGVLEKLLSTRQTYNFTFNPNVQHAGVQGRISPHGLVLVVACGTLHIGNRWVVCSRVPLVLCRIPLRAQITGNANT
uniref:Putative h cysteine-type endopeptidase n=1 Tax=Lutzomyia longipalpis TaxID=7200 RepID=A0A7G3ALJ8_LUTLO